jgi:hypothetical protein
MPDKYDVAERLLMGLFSDRAVSSVDFIAGPGPVSVWLKTETDAEARSLRTQSDARKLVSRALVSAAMSPRDIEDFRVSVQSEETVARDFEGS